MFNQLCSRCKKNAAVVFVTKIESGSSTQHGLCLRCAKELNIQPIGEMLGRMGISDEDIDSLSGDMMDSINGSMNELLNIEQDSDTTTDEDGKTTTFPFLSRLFSSLNAEENPTPPPSRAPRDDSRRESRDDSKPRRKYLESYCISLSQRAREGKLDRVVGRENEIARVIQILNRRQKNNPCLIGEPGVGKTAIAEGLAQRIADGDVPVKLRGREVHLLDLTSLVAGTQFRGQFETRMKGLIEEIRKLGNIILVIDEVHSIVGAGDAEGSMNAANILKPALSRGEIQVVGATTFNEYRKHIEKDAALERRFQPVSVVEPSIEESVEILQKNAHYYEEFHGVSIPPLVAREAVILSERYITDRFLPDKAIDLIDEACSDLNLKSAVIAERESILAQLAIIAKERETLETDPENYVLLAEFKSRELKLEKRLSELDANGRPALTADHLANVIEQWTKIPASSIKEAEYTRLARLEERLKTRIIGQDEAIHAVAAAIARRRVGISAKRKPVSLIFAGPTGVGKTELVKCLAQDLFDSPEALIRLDMSEFMEKFAVSRIIGAPPGYVGYDEAGQLTEKIRRKPYSVVLFDEIEKAHPDVLNILLQILDDGHITDAHGRRVNFENTVIIMTTNAGSDKASGAVGFIGTVSQMGKERAMKALNDILRPEFINRVDDIIAFNQLSESDFAEIARIMLDETRDSMKNSGFNLSYDDKLIEYLVKKSFSLKYGARNLRRTMQKDIEDALATEIIGHFADIGTDIGLTVEDGAVAIKRGGK